MSLLHVLFNNEFELILNPADTSYPPVSYLGFLNYKISYTLLYWAVFGLKNGGQGASCKDDFALYFVFWMSQFFIYATKFIIVCRTVWGWIWDVSNSVQQKGFKQKVITQANQGERIHHKGSKLPWIEIFYPGVSEVAEVAEVKQPWNSKRQNFSNENWLLLQLMEF